MLTNSQPFDGPRSAAFSAATSEFLKHGETGDAIAIVGALIAQGTAFSASDIYLEPWEEGLAVRFRIDGVLHDLAVLPAASHQRVVARIKVLAKLPVYERTEPQDGRIEAGDSSCSHALRVSTFPTVHGESVVLRVLGQRGELETIDELGLADEDTRRLRELVRRPQGVILLTGPTSSGKTTTIYALLREILDNTQRARHVVTIEDPVEYRIGRVAQTQISPHGPMTFVTALRSILRQDPDVVMIGEIRDSDTARAAIQAGLTGHLVISTIHSGSAAGVFGRLLDMGVEPSLIGSSVTGVLAQRLIRLNCAECGCPHTPEKYLLDLYHIAPDPRLRMGTGCAACHGIGYRGRTAVGELLTIDREFADCIRHDTTIGKLQDLAIARGMSTLLNDALGRVMRGETTLEELVHVIPADPSHTSAER